MDTADQLLAAITNLHAQGFAPATSGNFSARYDADHVWLTASGKHKGRLTRDDLLLIHLASGEVRGTAGAATTGKPSAETLLHLQAYHRWKDLGAVLHVHSITATVMSRLAGDAVTFENYELCKALYGIRTHEYPVTFPVFDNTQDMRVLAEQADQAMKERVAVYGYLIRGHGLYTWGPTLDDAMRHVEAIDFMLRCELEERRLR